MKKIPDIINRLWNVCGQMEVGALLTCGSGIILYILTPKVRGQNSNDKTFIQTAKQKNKKKTACVINKL